MTWLVTLPLRSNGSGLPTSPLPQGRSAVINGGLYVNNTEDGDGGVYICTATNKHGIIIHGTFLKVEPVGKLYYIVTVN